MKKLFVWFLSFRFICADILYLLGDKKIIRQDMSRYSDFEKNSVFKMNYLLQYYKPFRNVFYFRVKKYKIISFLSKMILPPLDVIEIKGEIKGGLKIYHNYGCVISLDSADENLTVLQGVTIGGGGDNSGPLRPRIGKNVTIGANALVIGNVKIGDNAFIGAGCVVTHNVMQNEVVVGNPQRVLRTLE